MLSEGRVVIVCPDPALTERLLAAVAAARLEPVVVSDDLSLLREWGSARAVLVHVDALPRMSRLGLARRQGVHGLASKRESLNPGSAVWRLALELGVEQMFALPEDFGVLIDALNNAAKPATSQGLAVGFVPARGGAGASTLLLATAHSLVSSGRRVCAIDLDPTGPGLGAIAGLDSDAGADWSSFSSVQGVLSPDAFARLPVHRGISVLAWGPESLASHGWARAGGEGARLDSTLARDVCESAQRAFDFVLVDLPKDLSHLGQSVLSLLDRVYMVSPLDVGGGFGGARVRAQIDHPRVRLVARGPSPAGLPVESLAAVIGCEVALSMGFDNTVARDVELGRFPHASRPPLARRLRHFLGMRSADGVLTRAADDLANELLDAAGPGSRLCA